MRPCFKFSRQFFFYFTFISVQKKSERRSFIATESSEENQPDRIFIVSRLWDCCFASRIVSLCIYGRRFDTLHTSPSNTAFDLLLPTYQNQRLLVDPKHNTHPLYEILGTSFQLRMLFASTEGFILKTGWGKCKMCI